MWTAGNIDGTNKQPDKRNGGKEFEQKAGFDCGASDEDAEVSFAGIYISYLYLICLSASISQKFAKSIEFYMKLIC